MKKTKLTFNETTYEFVIVDDTTFLMDADYNPITSQYLRIYVNGELRKVLYQVNVLPSFMEECVELINEYEL